MAQGDITIGFCLDQSGSMQSGKQETLDGFNKFLEEQASTPGNAYLTFVLFDNHPTVRLTGGDMKLVDPLGTKANPYGPSGGTALYDGVVRTIREVEGWHKANATFAGQTVIVVLTDGYENASATPVEDLNKLMTDKKEQDGWEFVFIGSGGAAWTEGQNMNVSASANYAGNAQSMGAYSRVSKSISTSRLSGQSVASYMVPKEGDDPT